jgi:nicotinamide-nucleotide amidase
MDLESKVLSKEILYKLYESGKTVGTAESCTSGRLGEAISSVPGASTYFKGGIICYATELKTDLLGVSPELIEDKDVVSEEVAKELVKGAIKHLKTDYAIATTGYAGPGGGTDNIPVGTIWIACGSKDDIRTMMIQEDDGREINLDRATFKAMQLFVDFLKEIYPEPQDLDKVPVPGME